MRRGAGKRRVVEGSFCGTTTTQVEECVCMHMHVCKCACMCVCVCVCVREREREREHVCPPLTCPVVQVRRGDPHQRCCIHPSSGLGGGRLATINKLCHIV